MLLVMEPAEWPSTEISAGELFRYPPLMLVLPFPRSCAEGVSSVRWVVVPLGTVKV
jgi:hypothetical protein